MLVESTKAIVPNDYSVSTVNAAATEGISEVSSE
jgi:hypothetical protein